MTAWCYWICILCVAEFAMYKADDDEGYINPDPVAYTISSCARDMGVVEMQVRPLVLSNILYILLIRGESWQL